MGLVEHVPHVLPAESAMDMPFTKFEHAHALAEVCEARAARAVFTKQVCGGVHTIAAVAVVAGAACGAVKAAAAVPASSVAAVATASVGRCGLQCGFPRC